MKPIQIARVFVGLVCAAMFVSVSAADPALEEVMSHDGLQKIKIKDVDLAYVRPGASLAGYKRIMLDSVEVSFSKTWDPKQTGSAFKLSAEDRENIRTGVAKLVQEEFTKTLSTKGGYPIVTQSGPDVLRVKTSIVNLYVNAPDTKSAGRNRTYTASAGEMTLVAEYLDSESNQVLARVVDRREGRAVSGQLSWSNSVMNQTEAETIASAWARILRKSLDKANGAGKK